MARCSVEEVKEIFNTNLDDDKITACITAANVVVTNGPAASTSPALSVAENKEIERWLAAHFCCTQDPIALRSKIGDAESWNFPAAVTTAWGKNYNLTVPGQMAVAMDRTGILASAGNKRGSYRAGVREDSDAYTPRLTKA